MKAICGKIKVSFYGGQKICAIIFTAGILNASRKPRPCQSSLRFTGQDKRNLVPFRSLRRIMLGMLIILPRHSTGQEEGDSSGSTYAKAGYKRRIEVWPPFSFEI